MIGDQMGEMRRAWLCCGLGCMVDPTLKRHDLPYLLAPEDERPVLCLPPGRNTAEYELMFGWGMAQLLRERHGWLEVVRRVARLAATIAA